MDTSLRICGREFTAELVEHLRGLEAEDPGITANALGREVCAHLGWYSGNGQPAVSSAKVAVRKLRKRGLLRALSKRGGKRGAHRLRGSGQALPAVQGVPKRVDQVRGLRLELLSGQTDAHHGLWNDLMIQQHPCGDAPIAGPQVRYLIGSEHGWLGAFGFGPAAFVLGARDAWIGWTPAARVGHLREVVGLARFLIRREVRCAHLASKVLSLALQRLPGDWEARYGSRPVLVETHVDRERFTGLCFRAANWRRIGSSTGRGRLGARTASRSPKDIWVYELRADARGLLQQYVPPPLTPSGVLNSLNRPDWWAEELAGLDVGDRRRRLRAEAIIKARWRQPQASFYGSFDSWAAAKGAYGLIEHKHAPLSLQRLLEPHAERTRARMAAERLVLLPQDTTTLNFSGLAQTSGLGSLGDEKGRGLWLHSLLVFRPDGVPLGLLHARCWAREAEEPDARGRNAKSLDEKESGRWLEALQAAGAAARRMPQTQVVTITDREGDLYELHDAVHTGPPNLHTLIRAQHDRNLPDHQKLWGFLAAQPPGATRTIELPRRKGQRARPATVQIHWSPITIQAPQVGCKKGWPPVQLWAVWVHEPHPPAGAEPLDWMLLSDLPLGTAEEAWERVGWYRIRWGIEEWHRVLKTGCAAEAREFKTAEHLQRVLAFDLMVAWRILACLKLGRALPQLPARVIYTDAELAVIRALAKKKHHPGR